MLHCVLVREFKQSVNKEEYRTQFRKVGDSYTKGYIYLEKYLYVLFLLPTLKDLTGFALEIRSLMYILDFLKIYNGASILIYSVNSTTI